MIGPVTINSADPATPGACPDRVKTARRELEKVLNEPHALEGEVAYQGTLADWRNRVAGKAKELADSVAACRQLRVSERGKQIRRAVEAVQRTIDRESYVYARFEAAETIIYIAARSVAAKAPARESGRALDQANVILTELITRRDRESCPTNEDNDNWWGNTLDLDGSLRQIRQLREKIGYVNLLKTR